MPRSKHGLHVIKEKAISINKMLDQIHNTLDLVPGEDYVYSERIRRSDLDEEIEICYRNKKVTFVQETGHHLFIFRPLKGKDICFHPHQMWLNVNNGTIY